MLGKTEGRRRRGRHRMRWFHGRLNGHEFEQILGDVKNREAWHAAVQGVAYSLEILLFLFGTSLLFHVQF